MSESSLAHRRGIKERLRLAAFRLADVDVYPGSGRISGPGGRRQLDPKVMEVLLVLVAANGEVVGREELLAEVWEGTIVTDFALSRCIYQLRQKLGQVTGAAKSPIETLPKRGYRLAWPLLECEEFPAGHRRLRRPYVAVLAAISVAALAVLAWLIVSPPETDGTRTAIAVLPFADLTDDGTLGYFGDGVATSLMTELGRITEIDVIARTSSFHFKGKRSGVAEIAATLNVGYLVEGSVNGDNESVQVTAALVDAADGRQVWSRKFGGAAGQSFTVQQEIAAEIAGYLELSLGEPRKYGGTTSFDAYNAYLKGVDSVNTVNDDGLGEFYLDLALAHDSDFARALEAKAFFIYLRLWQGDGVVEEAWAEARPLLERALEITDQSPWSHGLMAGFQIFRGEYEAAEESLDRALEINPSHDWALVHLSRLMEHTGRLDEAVKLAERNVRLDPLNPFRHIQLANRRWTAGDFEGGKASFERAIKLDPLNYAGWRDYCLRLSNKDGEVAGFRLLARLQENPEFRAQFLGPEPQLAPTGIGLIALWLGHIGDHQREMEMLDLQSRLGDSAELHREMAWSLLARGELEQAWEETWFAASGMPRNHIINRLIATVAIQGEFDPELAENHYREYWPGLFETPPVVDDVEQLTAVSAALVLRAQGRGEQGDALLEALLARDNVSLDIHAMALAHLGQSIIALDALESHVSKGGYFSYLPGDPFWAPLAGEPRFLHIVEAEAAKDASAREEVALMIERGDLVLPGGH